MTPIALRNFVLDPRLEVVARIRPFDCGLLQELIDYNSLGASMLEPFTENPATVNISGTCFQRNFLKALWDVDLMIGNNVADLHSSVLIQMKRHARRYALQWDRTYPVQVDGCPNEWIIVQAAPETPFEMFLEKVRSTATPYNHIMMLAAAEIHGATLCLVGRYVLAFNTPDVTDDRQKLQIVMKTTIVGGLLHVTLMKGNAKIDISKCRLPSSDQANLFYFGKSGNNSAQCHTDSSATGRTPSGTTQTGRDSLYLDWNLCYGADIAIRKAIHFSYLPNKEGNVELLFSACRDCGITNHRGNIGRYGVHVDVAKDGQESINVCLMCAFQHIQRLSEHSRQICYCKACHEITSLMCEYSKAEQNECVDAFPAATIFHQAEACRIPVWELIDTKREGDDDRDSACTQRLVSSSCRSYSKTQAIS